MILSRTIDANSASAISSGTNFQGTYSVAASGALTVDQAGA
jgi:hypothetical protein